MDKGWALIEQPCLGERVLIFETCMRFLTTDYDYLNKGRVTRLESLGPN